MIASNPSVEEYTPMRVNIRFITKNISVPAATEMGSIAPPSTPIHLFYSRARPDEFTDHTRKNREDQRRDKEEERTEKPAPKQQSIEEICDVCDVAESPLDEDKFAASLEKPLQIHYNLLPLKSKNKIQKRKTHKRCGVVITPFSERQKVKENDIYTTGQLMPLQTTGGYFKGKPPITPFTRLGCFRMQNLKSDLEILSKRQNTTERCYTAEVPRLVKPLQRQRRPATHVPQKKRVEEIRRPTLHKPTSVNQLRRPADLPSLPTKLKQDQTQGVQILNGCNEKIFPLSSRNPEERSMHKSDSVRVRFSSEIPSQMPEYKQMQVFQRISVSQISPFRRNLKINSDLI